MFRLEEFLLTLNSLVQQGMISDVMLIKGGCQGISIHNVGSLDEFMSYIVNSGCDTLVIKLARKIRYERPIYIHQITDFKLNNCSLVINTNNGRFTDKIKLNF